jgi:hypothetical protein
MIEGQLQGLIQAAARMKGWIVSGGTNKGCMLSLGNSYAKSVHKGEVPVIGVATFGKVCCRKKN